MSASSSPTLAPSAARASARFTAVVLLPTPPLPEATAMMLRTFGSGFKPFCTACAATLQVTETWRRRAGGGQRRDGDAAHLILEGVGGIAQFQRQGDPAALQLNVTIFYRYAQIQAGIRSCAPRNAARMCSIVILMSLWFRRQRGFCWPPSPKDSGYAGTFRCVLHPTFMTNPLIRFLRAVLFAALA